MILSTLFSIGPDVLGMPTIVESGYCTNEESQLTALREYENEQVSLERVRRRTGIIAKSLTAVAIKTKAVKGEQVGSFSNCMQMGRTQFALVAPKQPLGKTSGKMILRYSRTWLHLGS